MSSNRPTTTQPGDDSLDHLSNAAQNTQMARAFGSPPQPPLLPTPAPLTGERRQLHPLPKLQPPSGPHSSQSQPFPPSLPERPHQISYSHNPPIARPPLPPGTRPPQASTQQSRSGPVSSAPHPHLYAQKASYQSRNPGTVYEALSPVEYGTGGRASLFNEAAYNPNPYAPGSIPFQSPTVSDRSSTTSSSGAASGPGSMPYSHQPSIMPLGTGPASTAYNDMIDRYILTIRQQPLAARACGFGERDRRVIDPPPIVQLLLKDYDPRSPADVAELQFPFHMVHCDLLSANSTQQSRQPTSAPTMLTAQSTSVTAVQDPNQNNRLSRRLMGTLCATSFVGTDPECPPSSIENANLATFFIFQDLSCRQNGLYRLKFTLMRLPIGPNMVEGDHGSLCGSVESDVFEVFSAKDFPGMKASTALTRDLKRQGAPVSVKKGKDPNATAGANSGKDKRGDESESASGEEVEMEVGEKGRPRKKRG